MEKLRRKLTDIKIGDSGYIYVVDNSGKLISHPSQKYVYEKPDLTKRKLIADLLADKIPTAEEEQYKNEKNIIVTSEALKVPGLNWIVVFEQPLPDVLSFSGFMRNLFIVNLAGSLLILLIIALILSDNFTRPIRKLKHLTQLLEKGQFDPNTKITTGDEIESLGKSFNSMAIRLLEREDNLKKEKQEREIILQSLTDGVFAVNQDNVVKVINKAAQAITGYSKELIIDKNIDDILKIEDHNQQIKFSEYKERTPEQIIKFNEKGQYLINAAGEKIKITLFTIPVESDDPNQKRWVITIHDMRKEQELEEMKVDFVSMAAHELRTPLTEIRGYASLIKTQTNDDPDNTKKEMVIKLLLSTDRLNNLIDN